MWNGFSQGLTYLAWQPEEVKSMHKVASIVNIIFFLFLSLFGGLSIQRPQLEDDSWLQLLYEHNPMYQFLRYKVFMYLLGRSWGECSGIDIQCLTNNWNFLINSIYYDEQYVNDENGAYIYNEYDHLMRLILY